MKNYFQILVLLLVVPITVFAQKPVEKKISISGKVFEKGNKIAIEYATVSFKNTTTNQLFGAMTDASGTFTFEITPGEYSGEIELMSYKKVVIAPKKYTENSTLGAFILEGDISQLQDVVVIAEKSTVEIKLDKRVYNVGKDMMVKGGTVSDVLDNVPSVTVDTEGNVALRGNENVRILIDGKPSGLAGINVADALKLLPADAVEKVEVITNPSARYDAEGGGGIINIVLRKGKSNGVNGSIIVSTGDPENYGVSTSLNKKGSNFNLFSNFGYNYRNNPGNSLTNAEYFN
jgi:hypothetical protein